MVRISMYGLTPKAQHEIMKQAAAVCQDMRRSRNSLDPRLCVNYTQRDLDVELHNIPFIFYSEVPNAKM